MKPAQKIGYASVTSQHQAAVFNLKTSFKLV